MGKPTRTAPASTTTAVSVTPPATPASTEGAAPAVPPTIHPAHELDKRIAAVKAGAEPTVADWVLLASFNDSLLEKEFKLQNDRVSWMMTSQSILFAAFCLILLARKDLPESVATTATILLYAIPGLSLAIVVAALLGVGAAQAVIWHLERERSFYQGVLAKLYHQPLTDVGCRREGGLKVTRKLGFIPMFTVIAILALIWVVILGSRVVVSIQGF